MTGQHVFADRLMLGCRLVRLSVLGCFQLLDACVHFSYGLNQRRNQFFVIHTHVLCVFTHQLRINLFHFLSNNANILTSAIFSIEGNSLNLE